MSSILKALQRVEKDRPPGASGAPRRALRGDFVAESGGAPLRRPRARRSRTPLWVSLGVVALVGLLVWWRLPESSPAPEVDATAQAAAASEAAPVVAPEAAPVVAPEAPAAAETLPAPAPGGRRSRAAAALARAEAQPIATPQQAPPTAEAAEPLVPAEVAAHLPPLGATLEATAPEPAAAPAPEPRAAVAPEPEPAPPPRSEPSIARAAPAAPAPTPAPEPKVAAPEPKVAAPEPKVAAPEPAPKRPAATPAPAPVAAVSRPSPPPPRPPAVAVERTRWHPTPERRVAWVTVEGFAGVREVSEGDAMGALVVKEIKPSSVEFLHGSETLSRRIGGERGN